MFFGTILKTDSENTLFYESKLKTGLLKGKNICSEKKVNIVL